MYKFFGTPVYIYKTALSEQVLQMMIFSSILCTSVYRKLAFINNTLYVVESKSFRPDKQKPRQMENAVRLMYQLKSVLK